MTAFSASLLLGMGGCPHSGFRVSLSGTQNEFPKLYTVARISLKHYISSSWPVSRPHGPQPVFRMPAAMALIEREITRRNRSSRPGSRACFSRLTWITLSGSR